MSAKKVAVVAKKRPKAVALMVKAIELRVHPLLAPLPIMDEVVVRLGKDAASAKGGMQKDKKELHEEVKMGWAAFVADVGRRGVVEPLIVVAMSAEEAKQTGGKWWIVDGRHRFAGGSEAGIKLFPIRVSTEAPATFMMGAMFARNNWNKGQIAFMALHLHPYLIEATQGRKSDEIPTQAEFQNRGALGAAIGVSADIVDRAARVHALFIKDPAAKKRYLPLVFAGVSLKGILAGDGAQKSEHGAGDERQEPWMRLRDGFADHAASVKKEWALVTKAGAEAQAEVKDAFTKFLNNLPAPLREHAGHVLNPS